MTKHFLATAIALVFVVPVARADIIYTVTADTTGLASNPGQGPFAVDFQLNDGSGAISPDGNNTAAINNFNLGSGSLGSVGPLNPPAGGVTGDLNPGDTLSITDSGFFNDYNQGINPGSQLSFTLDLTTFFSAAEQANSPDQFSFTIVTNLNNPNGPTTDAFVDISIDGLNPTVSSNAGALVPAPTVTPNVSSTPEPSTMVLSLIGLAGLAGGSWRRRRQRRDAE